MPKGDNPNSRKNLKNGNRFNSETAAEAGRKSGKSPKRQMRKDLKMCLDILLEKNIDSNGHSGAEAMAISIFKKALSGDVRAFEVIRDTIGQKPVDKVIVSDISQETIDEVERMIENYEKEC